MGIFGTRDRKAGNKCFSRVLFLGIVSIAALWAFVDYFVIGTWNCEHDRIDEEGEREAAIYPRVESRNASQFPVICIVICDSTEEEQKGERIKQVEGGSSVTRQLDQASVLIKSAVTLSTTNITFIVLVDEDWLFENLESRFHDWPLEYKAKLTLEKRAVWYPEGTEQRFRPMFRICATERLFLPDYLRDLDSVIYLDTDFVFMRPPQELWKQFQDFDPIQLAGFSPSLYYYNENFTKFPVYGSSGINSGLWMMNLTRMQDFRGGWFETLYATMAKYEPILVLVDQDLLNIIFSQYPEYVYDVGCNWNYRMKLCSRGKQLCKMVEKTGVSLFHGAGLSFHSKTKEKKLKEVYEAWKNYKVGTPLKNLLSDMQHNLKKVKKKKSGCKKVKGIDSVFTKGLYKYTQTQL